MQFIFYPIIDAHFQLGVIMKMLLSAFYDMSFEACMYTFLLPRNGTAGAWAMCMLTILDIAKEFQSGCNNLHSTQQCLKDLVTSTILSLVGFSPQFLSVFFHLHLCKDPYFHVSIIYMYVTCPSLLRIFFIGCLFLIICSSSSYSLDSSPPLSMCVAKIVSVSVCQSCHNSRPQSGQVTQQQFIYSKLWRLGIQDQGNRFGFF